MRGGKWVIIGSVSAMAQKSAVAALHVLMKLYRPSGIFLTHDRDFNLRVCQSLVGFGTPIKLYNGQEIACVVCICARDEETPFLEAFREKGVEVRVLRVDCP